MGNNCLQNNCSWQAVIAVEYSAVGERRLFAYRRLMRIVFSFLQRLIELSKKIDMKALEGSTKIAEEFKVVFVFLPCVFQSCESRPGQPAHTWPKHKDKYRNMPDEERVGHYLLNYKPQQELLTKLPPSEMQPSRFYVISHKIPTNPAPAIKDIWFRAFYIGRMLMALWHNSGFSCGSLVKINCPPLCQRLLLYLLCHLCPAIHKQACYMLYMLQVTQFACNVKEIYRWNFRFSLKWCKDRELLEQTFVFCCRTLI